MAQILFITGTDTGVGKTVLTALLARHLRRHGVSVAALKPISSGSRDDARVLHEALEGTLALDEINPWHFRLAAAPVLAARREKRRITKGRVTAHVRRIASRFEVVLVEGAGGLLSPLGEDFDSRDLIVALQAKPLVVAANRLGAVNQVRLVLAALLPSEANRASVILAASSRPNAVSRSNPELLRACVPADRLHVLPWLGPDPLHERTAAAAPCTKSLRRLMNSLLIERVRT